MGVGLKTNEVEIMVTLLVGWDGAGAWAGDVAIGAVPAETETEATPEVTLYNRKVNFCPY